MSNKDQAKIKKAIESCEILPIRIYNDVLSLEQFHQHRWGKVQIGPYSVNRGCKSCPTIEGFGSPEEILLHLR